MIVSYFVMSKYECSYWHDCKLIAYLKMGEYIDILRFSIFGFVAIFWYKYEGLKIYMKAYLRDIFRCGDILSK